jgi:hypothetical protein
MIINPKLKSLSAVLFTLVVSINLVLGAYTEAVAENTAGVDPVVNELLQRFSDSKAVGVFTKLSIKNNITHLNQSFGTYHQGKRPPTIEELRESYDLMVQEIMVLIQNKDPVLARDLYETRLLLWSYLVEPDKYALFQEI